MVWHVRYTSGVLLSDNTLRVPKEPQATGQYRILPALDTTQACTGPRQPGVGLHCTNSCTALNINSVPDRSNHECCRVQVDWLVTGQHGHLLRHASSICWGVPGCKGAATESSIHKNTPRQRGKWDHQDDGQAGLWKPTQHPMTKASHCRHGSC